MAQKQTIKIFDALYSEQKDIAADIFSGEYSIIGVQAGRQSGKSFAGDRSAIGLCLHFPGIKVIWATPYHGQSLDAQKRHEAIIYGKIQYQVNHSQSDRCIKFDNGSVIIYRSAENPKRLRGETDVDYLFCDEFGFFKEGVYEFAIEPYFIANKDMVGVFTSTPFGANKFYELINDCKDPAHKDKVYHKLHYSMNPNSNMEFIEEKKKTLPTSVFLQEYEGEFVFGNSVVFGNFNKRQLVTDWQKYNASKYYFYGIDWATGAGEDKTVITIIDNKGDIAYIEELPMIDEVEQCKILKPIIEKYHAKGYGENNSIGHTFMTILRKMGVNVDAFNTSQNSKADLVGVLLKDIHEDNIKLPASTLCPKLSNEMNMYEVKKSANGKLSYGHPLGMHDDYIDSLLLSNRARHRGTGGDMTYTPVVPSYNKRGVFNNSRVKSIF